MSVPFRTATASPRRDPLAIDLDGDGIETIGIPTDGTLPVLFDHDADGVKAGTGWLKPDDGWLVRDINGNGIIDSGRELFGADTQITKFWSSAVNEISTTFSYTENALTGFEALRALDTGPGNGSPVAYGSPGAYDGLIDSRDAAFSELRIWRDLNSDGVSQEGELQTLAQAGIESIGVRPNDTNTNLGNGNTVTGTATVTRTGGTQEQIGSVDLTAGNLNLGSNPFYRTFTDSIPLTDTARALPEMGGSGWLRDLREALSLGTPASAELVDVVQQFAAATTRDAQMALLDKVLSKWAGTTGKLDTRYADFLAAGGISAIAHEKLEFSTVAETAATNTFRYVGAGPDNTSYLNDVVYQFSDADLMIRSLDGSYGRANAAGLAWMNHRNVLEVFNGQRNFTADITVSKGGSGSSSSGGGGGGSSTSSSGTTAFVYTFNSHQRQLIDEAYDALRESVYSALVVQTRLRHYTDQIGLVFVETGVRFTFDAVVAALQERGSSDPFNAVTDLLELQKYQGDQLQSLGWHANATLATVLDGISITPEVQGLLDQNHIIRLDANAVALSVADSSGVTVLGNALDNTIVAGAGADTLFGGAGNDTLNAVGSGDTLEGGDGDDTLNADRWSGGTTFNGGAGNDVLNGSNYADSYVFNRGDGQDVIHEAGPIPWWGWDTYADKLTFGGGIAASDVSVSRDGVDLIFKINGGSDQLTLPDWFSNGDGYYQIEQVRFADGTAWTAAQINTRALEIFGSASGDNLLGVKAFADVLRGLGGDDTLNAVGGGDTLDGGEGDDTLTADYWEGGTTFIGGAGDDVLNGSNYADSYVFHRGDGQDVIHEAGPIPWWGWDTYADKLTFGDGIAASDVTVSRSGMDLLLNLNGSSDQLTVANWFGDGGGYHQVEQVRFADGTTWSSAQISAAALEVTGSAGDDTLEGVLGFADVLHGAAGNDVLSASGSGDTLDGGDGDDTLNADYWAEGTTFIGGAGNDVLNGSNYADSYVFNRGDGQDVIHEAGPNPWWADYADKLTFGDGIAPSEVSVSRSGLDLLLNLNGSSDQLTVANWFGDGGGYYQVEQVRFADGTTWSSAQISAAALEVTGTAGDDTLEGVLGFADVLHGGAGNDVLSASGSGDTLDGGDGDDTLNADYWAEGTTFIGGAGNDVLNGSNYADSYVFNRGDGQDVIHEAGPNYWWGNYTDRLNFGDGIAASDVSVSRSGMDLLFKLNGGSDQLTVANWFGDGGGFYQVEQVSFADGTTWSSAQISAWALEVTGTPGDDTLVGVRGFANVLHGGAGNDILTASGSGDTLDGGDGDDTLNADYWADGTTIIGGAGNDVLTGSGYGDSYVFNRGDGQDVIHETGANYGWGNHTDRLTFGDGIAASDVSVSRSGLDLLFSLNGGSDQLTVADWFSDGDGHYQVEQVSFADGTTWSSAQISAWALEVTGTPGDDKLGGVPGFANVLHGGAGNDLLSAYGTGDTLDGGDGDDTLNADQSAGGTTFIGGAGNDVLTGSNFADSYIFKRGDGQDVIDETGAINSWGNVADKLTFGDSIAASDVSVSRSGLDLLFKLNGGSDQLTVANWFGDGAGRYQVEQVSFADGTTWSSAQISALALEVTGTAGDDALSGVRDFVDVLHGGAGNDVLSSYGTGDTLDGGDGDDTLNADYWADATTFIGGAGNDVLNGSNYADSYVFNRGDGQDVINEIGPNYWWESYTDKLTFGDGIAASDVSVSRSGLDLVLKLDGGSDQLTVANWFNDGGGFYQVEQVIFADGTTWSSAQISEWVLEVTGTPGDDTLAGVRGFANVLHGGAGNDVLVAYGTGDTLDGGDGDDTLTADYWAYGTTLIGGAGNDVLTGSNYSDNYVFNRGDGQDVITETGPNADTLTFGEGIAASDVSVSRSGMDLLLKLSGGDDQVTVANWFSDGGGFYQQVEQVNFADGTSWSSSQISALVLEVTGTPGDDTLGGVPGFANVLHGGAGNDVLSGYGTGDTLDGGDGDDTLNADQSADGTTLIGGAGNDVLNGSNHADTYVFNRGDGQDVIHETGANNEWGNYADKLNFGDGIAASDVSVSRSGMDLLFKLNGGNDQLTVTNWFSDGSGYYQVEEVSFADGTSWSSSQISALVLEVTGTPGDDTLGGLPGFANVLHGGAGNDVLSAYGTGDTLDGGDGDDTLTADDGAGCTTFIGGAGNDVMTGSNYGDSYVFNRGDGQDVIHDAGPNYWWDNYADKLTFGEGIAASDVSVSRSGLDLLFNLNGGSDQLTVANWFADGSDHHQIEWVSFADGTTWVSPQISAMALEVAGTPGDDTLGGIPGFYNVLHGGAGNDVLTAYGRSDALDGGDGDDTLNADDGAEGTNFIGGTGNDVLNGSSHADIYVFNRGDGQDVIDEAGPEDSWGNHDDLLVFGADVTADQLWFSHVDNNLEIGLIGTTDKITIADWYSGTANHVETFITSDGKQLLDSQVESLVNAMAAFAPPVAGQNWLPNDYQNALSPVVAASWH